jgi:hypothetical protein
LPRFFDDPSAAKLMSAARALPDRFYRLVVELLARAMRKGGLLGLTVDAVVQIGSAYWLRTLVGKMRTDRCIPCTPPRRRLSMTGSPSGPTGGPATCCSPTEADRSCPSRW